jgi:membrane associated rhomboid family serine protease
MMCGHVDAGVIISSTKGYTGTMISEKVVGRWKAELSTRILLLSGILLFLWFLEVVDWLWIGMDLDLYGIRPRTMLGLRNLLFAPWLHVGFRHLIANSVPFLILGWLVSLFGWREFWRVTLSIILISGLAIWLLGAPNSLHLGLSGVIFGYLGYLLVRGLIDGRSGSLLIAVFAFLLYGSMVWSLLSWQPGVSWLGHTFGFLGGIWAARRSALRLTR